jgi:MOSC domain-containing protein
MKMPVVSGLFVYPVKSTRGIARERVRLMSRGLEWDRHWMLVDAKGTFLSQRTHPQLARIVPQLTASALELRAPGMPVLTVPLAADGERIAVRVWKDACTGSDQGAHAHAWASEVAGQAVRLVRIAPEMGRVANPEYAGPSPAPMAFADGYPVLVCNESSLEDLNTRLPQRIGMERFRPNVVLRGLPAWAEDGIEALTIGAVTLRLVKPCTRCAIPSVDQLTGERSMDPLPVLRQFRFDRKLLGVTFGENAVIAAGTGIELELGTPCQVIPA